MNLQFIAYLLASHIVNCEFSYIRNLGSLEMVKGSPSTRWVWLVLDGQESRADFQCD